jgi:signal transduction histidine kinase
MGWDSAQQERMALLGKQAAGLAHELKNPSLAAHKAAEQLGTSLANVVDVSLLLGGADAATRERLAGLRKELERRIATPGEGGTLERSDAEDALGAWLEERGFEDGWSLTGDLVDGSVDVAWLEQLAAGLQGDQLPVLVRWLAAMSSAAHLAAAIEDSTARLSELVASVKQYTHPDRTPMDIDVRAGIDSTIKMMRHKLHDVTVRRDDAPSLPHVTAQSGELHQVWTNLLDNAAEAAGDGGTVTVRTRAWDGGVEVEVEDDGPGIPPEALPQVFEPFFTTKAPGEGTGLGLDTVQRIVRKDHGGDITVDSKPGHTVFRVRLPAASSSRSSG